MCAILLYFQNQSWDRSRLFGSSWGISVVNIRSWFTLVIHSEDFALCSGNLCESFIELCRPSVDSRTFGRLPRANEVLTRPFGIEVSGRIRLLQKLIPFIVDQFIDSGVSINRQYCNEASLAMVKKWHGGVKILRVRAHRLSVVREDFLSSNSVQLGSGTVVFKAWYAFLVSAISTVKRNSSWTDTKMLKKYFLCLSFLLLVTGKCYFYISI